MDDLTKKQLLAGGSLLTIAMIVSGAGNYLANLVLGKFLTTTEFGDAALMVTFLLGSTVLTGGTQLITAKATATEHVSGIAAAKKIRSRTTLMAAGLAAIILATSPLLTAAFALQSSWLIPLMALGLPAHLLLSVDRGQLQGQLELKSMAASFVAEVAVRLVATVGLAVLGMGALGATVAINLAFVGGLLVSRPAVRTLTALSNDDRQLVGTIESVSSPASANLKVVFHVALLSFGTVLITNGDLVAAKVVLTPSDAGRYALVGLVGRVVYMLAVSLHGTMIPVMIRAAVPDRQRVKRSCLGAIGFVSLAATAGIWILDDFIISLIGGSDYESVTGLLGPYALAAGLFTIASTSATLDLAVDRTGESWMVLVGAGLQTGLFLIVSPSSGQQIVTLQILAMTVLLSATLFWNRLALLVLDAARRTNAKTKVATPSTSDSVRGASWPVTSATSSF